MVIFFKKTENTEKMTLKGLLAVFLWIILLFFLAVGTLFIASITGFATGGIALLNTPTLLIDLLISLSEKQNKFVVVLIYLNVAVLLGIQMIMWILSAPLFLLAYGFPLLALLLNTISSLAKNSSSVIEKFTTDVLKQIII